MFSSILPVMAVVFFVTTVPDTSACSIDPVLEAAVTLTGAGSAEELDEVELERFRALAAHPLPLNRASRSKLLSCGLLSAYQVASLEDYKSMNGEVLSYAELLSVNGYNRETVACLKLFTTLDTSSPPSSRESSYVSHELVRRLNWKMSAHESVTAGGSLKYHLDYGDAWEFSMGFRESSSFNSKGRKSNGLYEGVSLAYFSPWSGRGFRLSKAVLGDFSLRFGQGLALWNGLSFSGFTTVDSFSRNATGAVPYRSYSGSSLNFGENIQYKASSTVLRGAAAEFSAGRFSLTSALAHCGGRDLLAAMNAAYYGRIHQETVTAYVRTGIDGVVVDAKIAADGRVNVHGTDLLAETSLDLMTGRTAFIAGARTKLKDKLTFAALARYYPSKYTAGYAGSAHSSGKCSDEHGAALAARFRTGRYVGYQPAHQVDASLDFACYPSKKHLQMKFVSTYSWTPNESWQLVTRLQHRLRNYDQKSRTELRTDVRWTIGKWTSMSRVHLLYGNAFGALGYFEAAYRPSFLNIYTRLGAFCTKSWDDRLYVYERDAPGGFSAPAFYGRGCWLSGFMTVDPFTRMRIYVRTSIIYAQERPLQCEATFQVRFSF